ncbi:MAG: hypothetical protein H6730_25625 [Deltaproteobacteria bacterium]|nr:hypothetical protein [Deltaproteobacteria bacterium]
MKIGPSFAVNTARSFTNSAHAMVLEMVMSKASASSAELPWATAGSVLASVVTTVTVRLAASRRTVAPSAVPRPVFWTDNLTCTCSPGAAMSSLASDTVNPASPSTGSGHSSVTWVHIPPRSSAATSRGSHLAPAGACRGGAASPAASRPAR